MSKTLGQGLVVSKQGLGCMSLVNNLYKSDVDDEKAVALVKHAISKGVTHFDTAIVYGPYKSEELLGAGIKDTPREKLVIATKTGFDLRPDAPRRINGSPELIRETCEACLKRLQVDYIDLFYLHRIDTETPIEDSMAELKKLVQEGKIRHIGLSEASASTIRRAHAVHPVTAVQLEWSLFSRDVEVEIVPTCRELGIGIVAYSPLGRGVLAGQFKSREDVTKAADWRANQPRFAEENLKKNLEFVEKVEAIAKRKGCTAGQLSLAWVIAQGNDVNPIPGTSKIAHLDDNLKANDISLSPEEVKELNETIPPDATVGDRYGPGIPTFKDN